MKTVEYRGKNEIAIDDSGAEGHELWRQIKRALRPHKWSGRDADGLFVFELEDEAAFAVAKRAIEVFYEKPGNLADQLKSLDPATYGELKQAYYDAECGLRQLRRTLQGCDGQLKELAPAAQEIEKQMEARLGILGQLI